MSCIEYAACAEKCICDRKHWMCGQTLLHRGGKSFIVTEILCSLLNLVGTDRIWLLFTVGQFFGVFFK